MAKDMYKLGRLPAVRPAALADLSVYATGKLPSPPDRVTPPVAPYPVDGNNQYGDCTIAGVAHLIEAWNMEVHEQDFVPTEQDVVDRYFRLTGGQDTGLVEADVLRLWHQKGHFRQRIAGYAPVDPRDILALHQAIAFYGGSYLGIECPESCQEQFATGHPWTYVPGSPIEGGHCIVALGYTQTGLLCATWGRIVEVTYGFCAHYLDEAWVVLSHQFVEAKGDQLGIDLATLQADLALV